MTPRERVRATLSHEEPDRVPVDLGQSAASGITAAIYPKLVSYLGLEQRPNRIGARTTQVVDVDEDVLRRLEIDFRVVRLGSPDHSRGRTITPDSFQDEWGVIWSREPGTERYHIDVSPFGGDATLSALEAHPWPDPTDPGRYRNLAQKAKQLHEDTDYALVLHANSSFFYTCEGLRGKDQFLNDLVENPTFAAALMDRCLEIRLEVMRRALEATGEYTDVIYVSGEDLGSPDGLLMPIEVCRELIIPRMKRAFDLCRSLSAGKRFFHTGGAIYPLIGDFIEIGAEVLNPIQPSAKGLEDPGKLKREFGDRLSFWGAIDHKSVLNTGTTEDVRQEVNRRLRELGEGGGYVLAANTNMSLVPPENIVTMFEAARKYGTYPLQA